MFLTIYFYIVTSPDISKSKKISFIAGLVAGVAFLSKNYALPFFIAFLSNRNNWGLLIPAYVLTVIGVMVPLIELGVLGDTLIATYVLLAIALPFFVVYLVNKKNWWGLIPGGILAVIGLGLLIAEASADLIFAAALILAGILIVVRQFTKKDDPGEVEELPEEESIDA